MTVLSEVVIQTFFFFKRGAEGIRFEFSHNAFYLLFIGPLWYHMIPGDLVISFLGIIRRFNACYYGLI